MAKSWFAIEESGSRIPAMLTLRKAQIEDAEILFNWRNDPATRAASLNLDRLRWADHLHWLEDVLGRRDRRLLIAELAHVAAGTIRIDEGAKAVLSITVAPAFRGRHIGRDMTLAALRLCRNPMLRIKEGNMVSQRVALAAGFACVTLGPVQIWELAQNLEHVRGVGLSWQRHAGSPKFRSRRLGIDAGL